MGRDNIKFVCIVLRGLEYVRLNLIILEMKIWNELEMKSWSDIYLKLLFILVIVKEIMVIINEDMKF